MRRTVFRVEMLTPDDAPDGSVMSAIRTALDGEIILHTHIGCEPNDKRVGTTAITRGRIGTVSVIYADQKQEGWEPQ